ncbi:adenylate kinase [Pasteuria penetrans]|uniref:adenylate kinase n=1 Tax=Pasteuria penetrans TaxID=86005 RepID=UPI000FBDAB0C|nr:adenylate kinase [Pasteuria penetrans]
MDIVLLGLPGAGKGTQASRMAAVLHTTHVATGDLFRQASRAETPLGNEARAYMERGWLVPDRVTVALVEERLDDHDCAQGCVLDGFPRTVAQAHELDRVLRERGRHVEAVVFLKVSRDVLLGRLAGRFLCRRCGASYHSELAPPPHPDACSCGGPLYQRQDDREETVLERLRINKAEMDLLLAYYDERGLLCEVDGHRPIEAVTAAVLSAVRSRAS